jgi:hypothetical protein
LAIGQERTFAFHMKWLPYLFRDTLMKVLGSVELEYKELVAA